MKREVGIQNKGLGGGETENGMRSRMRTGVGDRVQLS